MQIFWFVYLKGTRKTLSRKNGPLRHAAVQLECQSINQSEIFNVAKIAIAISRSTITYFVMPDNDVGKWLLKQECPWPVAKSCDRCSAWQHASIWNALPEETTSAQSLTSFRQHLKTWLLGQSYPDLIIWSIVHRLSNCFIIITVQPWSSYVT